MGKGRKRTVPFSGLSGYVQQAFNAENVSGEQPNVSEPPSKRQKLNVAASSWIAKYDASGSVPHYTSISDVPEHLRKYFAQRTRYFSEFESAPGCLLDEEGWYSVTPELIANQIAERCRCDTILDAFCGVGGNAIAFAQTCQRVIAMDTSPTRLALARHNAQIYGVAHHIEFILGDYISFAKAYNTLPSTASRKIDVVFLSPPWGGPSYLSGPPSPTKLSSPTKVDDPDPDAFPLAQAYPLSAIQPIDGADLFHLTRKITPNVAYYLPRNTNLEEVGALLTDEADEVKEHVEVEEEWMGNKLKAITCYFGGLVDGQGDMF
ncbi:S-adenosyl-L-methionine-dependent methyltransferase [Cylindrobasidium torrendii FP15055 ss-10]|uniref:Trimethylguanosine synthase n=1 Tax=Cylindrobasidium torrendii FP15055 ss-10 TaxID=1314674 RepID=A0A0D7B5Q3_9AGAR|nr:S-adenosyl-L-methionine-dependent methyltransferase [Cylindrobasidium torrendii FP15055 ss-10]